MQVAISWTLPTKRTDGTNLSLAEISKTSFSLSFNGGAFTSLVDIPAPTSTTTVKNTLTPGNYVLRAVVYDTQSPSKISTSVDTPFVVPVPVLAAPNPVSNVTAVVS